MKQFLRNISYSLIKIISKYFLSDRIDGLLNIILRVKEENDNVFITYTGKPKYSDQYNIRSEFNSSFERFSIVIQGPVMQENNFTLETIRIYKKNFPGALIVVSTWAGERDLDKLKAEGCIVIENEKPSTGGPQNINYQIKSTYAGIMVSEKNRIQYILKTRTDQRIYNNNVLNFFYNLTLIFPLKTNTIKLNSRLIIPSFGTLKYRLYGPSDMLMFGHISDMKLYWNLHHDDRIIPAEKKERTISEIAQLRLSEIYLCTEFLKQIGYNINWKLEDSWKVFAEYFCLADQSSIELYWPKYEKHIENKYHFFNQNHSLEQFSFSEWLQLYNGQFPKINEKVLTSVFGKEIR